MSPRSFLSLVVACVLAVIGAAVAIVSQQGLAARQLPSGVLLFPELDAPIDDLHQLGVETIRYGLVLERSDDGWVAVNRGNYPAVADEVANVVASLAAMTVIDPKTDNPEWYQYIEVAGPAASPDPSGIRLVATSTDGDTLVDAIVGKQSSSVGATQLGGTFVRPTDQAQAWLSEGVVDVPLSLQGWFDEVLHVPGPEVARIAILEGDEIVLDAKKKDLEKGDYELTYLSDSIGPTGSTANGDGIRGMSGAIVSVRFQDVRSAEDLEIPTDARTVRYITRDSLQIDATIGQSDAETWVRFAASAKDGEAAEEAEAINARAKNWAFKLSPDRIKILSRDLSELVYRPGEAPSHGAAPFNPSPGR